MSESSKDTSDIDENDEIVYTHPIVTEKKGYMDLMDYERNYQDMEARAKMQHVKSHIDVESMKPKVHFDQLEKREDDTTVPKNSTSENGRERHTKEPIATTSEMTDKNDIGKVATLTNTTKEHESVSMDKTQEINDSKDSANTSELTDISPEEAYLRHMERVISANTLPPQNMEILKNLYSSYSFNKKYASTIEETHTKTGTDTSDPSESKTDTHDQIEKPPVHDDEKPILKPSLKDPNNVIQSSTQEVSKNSALKESSAMDDEKMESLENTDLFVNNNALLTSTPKRSKEKIPSSSSLDNIKDLCDVTDMTIESPFSDFTLQTIKLKSGLKKIKMIKEDDSNVVQQEDKKEHGHAIKEEGSNVVQKKDKKGYSHVMKKEDNEEVNVIDTRYQLSSSSVSSDGYYPISLDVSKNVQLSRQKDIPLSKTNELFITEDDLACRCPQTETDAISNESNNVESIIERIRRYFLSLLIDYLVPRQMRTTKSKVSCM